MRCTGLFLATTMLFTFACRSEGGSVTPPPTRPDGGPSSTLECPGEGQTVCAIKLASSSRHPAVDEPVTLTNVVVTTQTVAISRFEGMVTLAGFYVQDPAGADFLDGRYSGVAVVYNPAQVAGTVPAIGTTITVEGTYAEFGQEGYDMQKQVRAARIESSGNLAPVMPVVVASPEIIARGGADAVAYEGVLVKVESVTVDSLTVTAPGGGEIFGAFRLAGGLVVSGQFYEFPGPVAGEVFNSITGVLRVGTAPFDAGEFMLTPRTATEVSPQNVRSVAGSIAAIQDPASPDRVTEICAQPDNGKPCPAVALRRVLVTAVDGYINANLSVLWVTDPNDADGKYASVAVVYNKNQVTVPAPGQFVDIEGTLQDFYGSRQISRPTITRNGTDTQEPVARVVTPATIGRTAPTAREYEGALVRVENVSVTTRCLESDSGRDFGGWVVTGDVQIGTTYRYDYNGRSIPTSVMCEDQEGNSTGDCSCAAMARPNDMRVDGDNFSSITGIVYYSFNTFQLVPRGNSDLVRQ